MHHLTKILSAHPDPASIGADQINDFLETFPACSLSCHACADACLAEGPDMLPKLRHCITTDLACAEITQTMATLLSRQTKPDKNVLKAVAHACETACRSCAEECEKHAAIHAHCEHCAKICRECERKCQALAQLL